MHVRMLPACKSATYLIIGHLKRLWEQALVVAAVANQDMWVCIQVICMHCVSNTYAKYTTTKL